MGMGFENLKKSKKENQLHLVLSILKLLLLAAIVAGIPLYIYLVHGDWLRRFEDVQEVVAFLEQYETESIPIYLGMQVLQIVISVLPGQVFQIAAGYMYPFWLALLLALTGAVIGTAITFGLAKLLGQDFLHLFFGEEKISYYIERLNSKRAYTLVFLIYLIPGIPKDVVSYAAGASEMRFKPFLILWDVFPACAAVCSWEICWKENIILVLALWPPLPCWHFWPAFCFAAVSMAGWTGFIIR